MQLVMLIKMYINETCSRARIDKHFSDMFSMKNCLKQGDVLSSLLFNFPLKYDITTVQVYQDGLKLTGTHQLLVYADDVKL
jgi:hypothetical protein